MRQFLMNLEASVRRAHGQSERVFWVIVIVGGAVLGIALVSLR